MEKSPWWTKCRIENCQNFIWSAEEDVLCDKHKTRQKTGRMLDNGEVVKEIKCKTCGAIFIAIGQTASARKYCDGCRKIVQPKKYDPNYTKRKYATTTEEKLQKAERIAKAKYVSKILGGIIRDIERREKYKPIIDMRESGATLAATSTKFGLSVERVRQIVKSYGR